MKTISSATEKLDKQNWFQPRDKSYLDNIPGSEAKPLKNDFDASVVNPKAVSLLRCKRRKSKSSIFVKNDFDASVVNPKAVSLLRMTLMQAL